MKSGSVAKLTRHKSATLIGLVTLSCAAPSGLLRDETDGAQVSLGARPSFDRERGCDSSSLYSECSAYRIETNHRGLTDCTGVSEESESRGHGENCAGNGRMGRMRPAISAQSAPGERRSAPAESGSRRARPGNPHHAWSASRGPAITAGPWPSSDFPDCPAALTGPRALRTPDRPRLADQRPDPRD